MSEKPAQEACPFCERIKRGEYELLTPSVVAFEPQHPVVPGHLLIVPFRHVTDATQDPDTAAATMRAAAEVAAVRYQSVNIITSKGQPATQTVLHLHLHIVPRDEGDGLVLPWTAAARDPEAVRLLEARYSAEQAHVLLRKGYQNRSWNDIGLARQHVKTIRAALAASPEPAEELDVEARCDCAGWKSSCTCDFVDGVLVVGAPEPEILKQALWNCASNKVYDSTRDMAEDVAAEYARLQQQTEPMRGEQE